MEFQIPEEFHDLPLEVYRPPEEFGILPSEETVIPEEELFMPPDEFETADTSKEAEKKEGAFSKLVRRWLYLCATAVIMTAAGHADFVKALYTQESGTLSTLSELPVTVSETVTDQVRELREEETSLAVTERKTYPLADEEIRIAVFSVPYDPDAEGISGIADQIFFRADAFESYVLPEPVQPDEGWVFSGYVMLTCQTKDPGYGRESGEDPFISITDRVLTKEDIENIPIASDGIRYIAIYPVWQEQ